VNHRFEKLSSLLNAADTQLNVANLNEISTGSINTIYEAGDKTACPSTIKVDQLSTISKSKTFKVNSSNNKTSSTQSRNSTQLNSIIHNRIHSKQQRFVSDQCKKTFTQTYNLTSHKILNSEKKPYQCELCLPKKFAKSFNLIVHKRLHSGETLSL
jgi:hypothetical protein